MTTLPAEPTTTGPDLGTEPLTAHTDGGAAPNPGLGGWAVIFSRNGDILREMSGAEPGTTNNAMELTAIRNAIQHAPPAAPLTIITDSAAAIGWLEQGWTRKVSHVAALCAEIDALRAGRPAPVSFVHVGGHTGELLNTRADLLVNQARAAHLAG
jgi:ribonuclease HI